MNKKFRIFWIAGFFFTCVLGTLLHFFYDFTGQNPAAGLFAPVDESTWEHLKMLFFPALIWTIAGVLIFEKRQKGLLWSCTLGICAGLAAIITVFYTYTGILGFNLLVLDVLTFYLGVFTTFYTAARRLKRNREYALEWQVFSSVLILLLFALCFFLFTHAKPPIALFQNP